MTENEVPSPAIGMLWHGATEGGERHAVATEIDWIDVAD
jgi:hypothetical protein